MKLNKKLIVIIIATLIIVYIIAIIHYYIGQIKINNYFKSNISKIVNEGDACGTKMLNDNTTGYTNIAIGYRKLKCNNLSTIYQNINGEKFKYVGSSQEFMIVKRNNVAIGHQAKKLYNTTSITEYTGNYNTSFGNEGVLEMNKPNGKIGWVKGYENTFYSYNVLIGEGAGKNFTYESFCVVVGHDSIAINAQGNDMIWVVDWDEPYLLQNPEIKNYLKNMIKIFARIVWILL